MLVGTEIQFEPGTYSPRFVLDPLSFFCLFRLELIPESLLTDCQAYAFELGEVLWANASINAKYAPIMFAKGFLNGYSL